MERKIFFICKLRDLMETIKSLTEKFGNVKIKTMPTIKQDVRDHLAEQRDWHVNQPDTTPFKKRMHPFNDEQIKNALEKTPTEDAFAKRLTELRGKTWPKGDPKLN